MMNSLVVKDQVERKVTKIGNSLGVTFPKEVLDHLGITHGDEVKFDFKNGSVILRKKKELRLPKGIDEEFLTQMNDMIDEYDETFKSLVDR
ncbi:AbrB/MazE/SpoVT family DNA-binding domain-containing protein [Gracilibacillus salinarum]|uniref:AbrB/MazE/SpoVT family DNA-binding domain-containing protein n=1 Tax=Gracilibacillus salinarum TaxID=2932255 RepID=A0ABY4GR12_9BACI|nr:AbrB/MazE/SpoVT family DNA-binding domain-containing protein [Gracilibacillus salinarum]UOQ86848.1 AbrB/MazE/SpoVT family DNA-binding domain-containing protein [Gracilibacillus salinarum]